MTEEQPTFRNAMISLYKDARDLCLEMIAFQPDLIAATLESGWYLTLAAKALWETSSVPFPPIIRLNIGSDKVDLFEQLDTPLRGIQKDIHVLGCRMHEFLAWLIDQKEWQSHFQQQITEPFGSTHPPERILIVDSKFDQFYMDPAEQDSDTITAIGLLDLLLPQTRVRTFVGKSKCQATLTYAWLDQFYPLTVADLQNAWNQHLRTARDSQQRNPLANFFSIASGVERGPAESISWRPLTFGSPLVQAWKTYLPLESWLELPEWVEKTISQEILSLVADPDIPLEQLTKLKSLSDEIAEALVQNYQHILGPALEFLKQQQERNPDPPRTSTLYDQNIRLPSRIMRDVYHDGWITSAQICSRYHITRREAARSLGYCIQRNELYPQGKGRGRYYIASSEYSFLIKNSTRNEPRLEDEIEILPEKLWLGTLPMDMPWPEDIWDYELHLRQLDKKGFTYLIKPSILPDRDQRYEHEMADLIEHWDFPMKFREYDLEGTPFATYREWMPRSEKIYQIVSDLEDILKASHKVYISRSEFGHLIVQCFMARRLGSVKKAFDYLKDCRAKSIFYWRSDLYHASNRAYVRRWMKRYYPENQNKR